MKHLTLLIPAILQRDIADVLRTIEVIKGFTLTNVEGHGSQSENDPFLSIRDKVVGYVPFIRIDLILEDLHLSSVLEALRESDVGLKKQSLYWISDIEKFEQL